MPMLREAKWLPHGACVLLGAQTQAQSSDGWQIFRRKQAGLTLSQEDVRGQHKARLRDDESPWEKANHRMKEKIIPSTKAPQHLAWQEMQSRF
ncbi:Acyl-CoA dehydrogenase family member 11 [Manis javanica]|nr:Acyl-CoA dehydrogenase family member 11 [Manis javanica]